MLVAKCVNGRDPNACILCSHFHPPGNLCSLQINLDFMTSIFFCRENALGALLGPELRITCTTELVVILT